MNQSFESIIDYFVKNDLYLIPLYSVKNGICLCKNGINCTSPGKHPLLHFNWKVVASNDSQRIRKWFKKNESINLGVVTGRKSKKSNKFLICVDVDLSEHELAKKLMHHTTFWYETGGGGYHFWYWSDVPVKNSVSLIANKIDIRGTNGYVVAPPSKHVSGKDYILRSDLTQPIANIPSFLLSLLKESHRETSIVAKKQNKKEKKLQVDKITEEWSKIPVATIREMLNTGTLVPLGARNVTLHRLLSSDRAKGVILKLELVAKAEEYRKHFEEAGSFSDQELELVVNSCMRYPAYNNAHEKVNECYISWLSKCGIEFAVDFPIKLQKLDDEFFQKLEVCENPVPLSFLMKVREDFLKKNGLDRISNYRPQLFAKKLKESGFVRIRNSQGNLWKVRLNYSG